MPQVAFLSSCPSLLCFSGFELCIFLAQSSSDRMGGPFQPLC